MLATLTSKGQITLPKAIRDQLGLDAGSLLDFQLLPDSTIAARLVKPDARRIRGLLKSPHATALTIEQMDEAIGEHLREKHPQADDIRRPPPEGDEQSNQVTFAHEHAVPSPAR